MPNDGLQRADMLAALGRERRKASAYDALFNQAVAGRLGINPTDLECLDILSWTGPLSAGRLAEITGLTTGAITGLVDRLEQAGYVQRAMDPRDRRRVIVQPLAGHSEREIAPYLAGMTQAMDALCARYSDAELATILDFTTRAHTVVQAETARLREAPPLKKARPA